MTIRYIYLYCSRRIQYLCIAHKKDTMKFENIKALSVEISIFVRLFLYLREATLIYNVISFDD